MVSLFSAYFAAPWYTEFMSSNEQVRQRVREVLRDLEAYRLAVVQASIRGLSREAQSAFLAEKTKIGVSGLDPASWAENELMSIFGESQDAEAVSDAITVLELVRDGYEVKGAATEALAKLKRCK